MKENELRNITYWSIVLPICTSGSQSVLLEEEEDGRQKLLPFRRVATWPFRRLVEWEAVAVACGRGPILWHQTLPGRIHGRRSRNGGGIHAHHHQGHRLPLCSHQGRFLPPDVEEEPPTNPCTSPRRNNFPQQ